MTPISPWAMVALETTVRLLEPLLDEPLDAVSPADVVVLVELAALVKGLAVPSPPVADARLRVKLSYESCLVIEADKLSVFNAVPALYP